MYHLSPSGLIKREPLPSTKRYLLVYVVAFEGILSHHSGEIIIWILVLIRNEISIWLEIVILTGKTANELVIN